MEIGVKTNRINTREVGYDRVSGRWRLSSTVAPPGGRATRRLALIVPLRRALSIYRAVNGAAIEARSRPGRAPGASGRARAPATDASIMRHPARHGATPVSGHLGRRADAVDRGSLTCARRPPPQQPHQSGRQCGRFCRKIMSYNIGDLKRCIRGHLSITVAFILRSFFMKVPEKFKCQNVNVY